MCLAVPGKILEITEDSDPLMRSGKVDFAGVVRKVNLGYVPEAQVDDYVNVHVGFALNIIDEKEAMEVYELLKEMGDATAARMNK